MASDDVPEYYRHLADKESEEASESAQTQDQTEATKSQDEKPPKAHYRADAFRMKRPAGEAEWTNRTTYTLTGPTTGGIRHDITVTVEPEVTFEPEKVGKDRAILR